MFQSPTVTHFHLGSPAPQLSRRINCKQMSRQIRSRVSAPSATPSIPARPSAREKIVKMSFR